MRHLYRIVFCVWCLSGLGSAHACSAGEPGCDVDKAEWSRFFTRQFPAFICAQPSPMRICSDANADECETLAVRAVKECFAELDTSVPDHLNRAEAGDAGELVGDCASFKIIKRIGYLQEKAPICAAWLKPAEK